jgi:hypothetical protein
MHSFNIIALSILQAFLFCKAAAVNARNCYHFCKAAKYTNYLDNWASSLAFTIS